MITIIYLGMVSPVETISWIQSISGIVGLLSLINLLLLSVACYSTTLIIGRKRALGIDTIDGNTVQKTVGIPPDA
jgi:hypothetical protein